MAYATDGVHNRAARSHDNGAWWLTLPAQRRVLVMAATMASTKRLLDVAALFHGDLRVQLDFTIPPNSFSRGTAGLLEAHGAPTLPWDRARHEPYDLALTANLTGMADVTAPVAVFSHGASRNSLAQPRGRGSLPVPGPVTGFSRPELIHAGMLVPAALALGHDRELELLEEGCPEALPIAHVVGDPCYDRITRQRAQRDAFRRALGVGSAEKLVVATSTWRPNSLLAASPHVVERLVGELTAPKYRVVLLTHPNIWSAHGSYQIHAWFGPWIRRGLVLVRPEADWQPILSAADYIVGDHGSVSLYGAAVGVPVLMGAFPEADVHPDSGAAALGAIAPLLSSARPLDQQLAHAEAEFDAEAMARVAATISSEPGAFARTTRRLLYTLLGLGQPATPASLPDAAMPTSLRARMPVPARHRWSA